MTRTNTTRQYFHACTERDVVPRGKKSIVLLNTGLWGNASVLRVIQQSTYNKPRTDDLALTREQRTEFICRLEILGARSNQTELIEHIVPILANLIYKYSNSFVFLKP